MKKSNVDNNKNSKVAYVILLGIIIILIIIIILLLCNYKKLMDNTKFTGNIEFFEVDCNCNNSGLLVSDDALIWRSLNKLNVFQNPLYRMDEVIAPGSSNSYNFVIKNNSDCDLIYSLSFLENNQFDINMKYRLKKNDEYIIDDWVDGDELSSSEAVLDSNKQDQYLLEWKWFDSDNDTAIGALTDAVYSLSIEIVGKKNIK